MTSSEKSLSGHLRSFVCILHSYISQIWTRFFVTIKASQGARKRFESYYPLQNWQILAELKISKL